MALPGAFTLTVSTSLPNTNENSIYAAIPQKHTLTWTASAGATGYNVFQCAGDGCTGFSLLATGAFTSLPARTYETGTLSDASVYRYRVDAFNSDGTTSSSVITIKTGATLSTVLFDGLYTIAGVLVESNDYIYYPPFMPYQLPDGFIPDEPGLVIERIAIGMCNRYYTSVIHPTTGLPFGFLLPYVDVFAFAPGNDPPRYGPPQGGQSYNGTTPGIGSTACALPSNQALNWSPVWPGSPATPYNTVTWLFLNPRTGQKYTRAEVQSFKWGWIPTLDPTAGGIFSNSHASPGASDSYEITKFEAYVTYGYTSDLTSIPPTIPSPGSNPCCEKTPTPGGPGTPGNPGDTPPPDPYIPLPEWIRNCIGGGVVLTAPDPTDPESYAL